MCVCVCVCVVVSFFGYQVGIWIVISILTGPICVLKQLVSVMQLIAACRNLGGLDSVQRARAKQGQGS